MKKLTWAERECRLACERENPNFDFDSNDFDYGCNCYKSALKAYNALCEDGHSGFSFGISKNILKRLVDGLPLFPIVDEDFFKGQEEMPQNSEEYLKIRNLKSDLQCPRKSSLFREETLDGKVSYHDIDRAYCINVERPSETYGSSATKIVDELFPITMPYMPNEGKYEVYVQSFLVDKNNGDFDTRGILYIITPNGTKVEVNRFEKEVNHKWESISEEEYKYREQHRIDTICGTIAHHLIWTLLCNSSSEEESERRKKAYEALPDVETNKMCYDLIQMCKFFENPENYRFNTFSMEQALCKGNKKVYEHVPELVAIAEYLKQILDRL